MAKNNANKNKGIGIALTAAALLLNGCAPLPSSGGGAGKTDNQATVPCGGINACKGQTACKSAANNCKGRNNCKGQGWLPKSREDCEKIGGTVLL